MIFPPTDPPIMSVARMSRLGLAPDRMHNAESDHMFKTLNLEHGKATVRPWASIRDVQPIPFARLGFILATLLNEVTKH